jgi:two-component system, OmpR family, phosphate regulon sensor histidine kinase PhoR
MSRKRIIPDPILMFITILVVTGFQVYWLKNSYDREKRTLQIKTSVAFQETVRRLQAVKLKLKGFDSLHKFKRVFIADDHREGVKTKMLPRRQIITLMNAMRDKVKDTFNYTVDSTVVLSLEKGGKNHFDSTPIRLEKTVQDDSNILKIFYGVDSLQDSLKIPEVTAAYQQKLKEELLPIPFDISFADKIAGDDEIDFSDVTVGLAHPVTYHLELGNTFPYLLKKIMLPVLFSIFLVGVTILSFVFLYKNLLKQQRLAEIKNEFIGNITHELKTPIATVGVAIEALKNFNAMEDPQRTKEYLDISSNELQRLGLLVDKVLKLSMFEKREIELQHESFDLRTVVDEVVASMRLQIEKYQAVVSITQQGDTNLQADRLHLLSVVFNLVDNALKYSKERPVIEIRLEGDKNTVEMQVTDNGIGIAPEYRNKIFEKFFRIPTGNMHNTKGYGLGLSYVAHVVQKHEGKISVDSRPGEGTIITVSIPKNNT